MDVLETLLVGIGESVLYIDVSVAAVLSVSVLAVVSVPVRVRSLTTGAPSPAFTPISLGHRDADVDRLMVCGQIWTVPGWLHEYTRHHITEAPPFLCLLQRREIWSLKKFVFSLTLNFMFTEHNLCFQVQ